MDKLKMQSMDMVQGNIEKIRQLFPNAVTEVKRGDKIELAVDFDVLKQELADTLIDERELRYQFTWPDKQKSILLANTPVTSTLRPDKEKSVDFDNTQNLYIEGDNLDVLKLLRETYLGKIKMIYIDPPYNTGNDFVYKDDFTEDSEQYLEGSGQYDEQGNRLSQNLESNGRFHTNWLNMIYPRLKVAKDLLSDDGVIFISIGDSEQANLNKVCDEIYGYLNFIGNIARVAKKGGNKGDIIKPKKDIVLVYAKNINVLRNTEVGVKVKRENIDFNEEIYNGEKRKYILGEVPYRAKLDSRPNQRYYIQCPDGSLIIPRGDVFPPIKEDGALVKPISNNDKCWTWSLDRYLTEKKLGRFYFYDTPNSPFVDENGMQSKWGIRKKIFESEIENDYYDVLSDFLDNFSNAMGTNEVDDLKIPFSYPKPSALIKYFAERITYKDSIILDFFSGSATTAHAVMQLNAEDGGNRKFIMVQLPEKCDEKSEAYKAGYKTICDIGEERIRRAGKKIKEENGLTAQNLDIGFRVLKRDTSNMQEVYYKPEEYKQTLLDDLTDNIKPDRTPLDLLFQVMLDLGVKPSAKIEEKIIADKRVYVVNDNELIACFDSDITDEVVKTIAQLKPLYAAFRDYSFASDSVAANFEQIFETYSPFTKRKVL